MLPLSFYLEYEEKIINLLKNQQGNTSHNLRSHYRYKHEGKFYEFDLVELDGNDKIKKVYEIKTYKSVKTNFNFIKGILQHYENVTKADVYLVYLDEDKQLKIIPLSKLVPEVKNPDATQTTIKSFSEFYDALKQFCNDENEESHYFFRGHSKYKFDSIPSIFRNGNIKYENRMFHEAIRKNPYGFTEDMSTFDKLVKMQHYELPTRLLDITTNPLVALFFACKENDNDDGEVLIFPMMDDQIKYYDSDSVCILSNLAKLSTDFVFTKDKGYLVYDIQQDKPQFNGKYLKSKATKEVFCVMPKLNNERIIRQQGAFFIFGMGSSKDKPAKFADEPVRIRVKAASKKDILKDLNLLGINEATLFPETDKIMKQIKSELNKQ